jgi:hypothetical protein
MENKEVGLEQRCPSEMDTAHIYTQAERRVFPAVDEAVTPLVPALRPGSG